MITLKRLRSLLRYSPRTGRWKWRVGWARVKAGSEAGCIKWRNNYQHRRRVIRIDGVWYISSQLAYFYMLGRWPRHYVDHRNGDPLDCRWSNLRAATPSESAWNTGRPRHNTIGFKGVVKKRSRFQARIRANGEQFHSEWFTTPEQAGKAYKRLAKELHGEFARWR